MTYRVSTEPSLMPDTPRERELRKNVNDLLQKIGRMAMDNDRQMDDLRAARDAEKAERLKDVAEAQQRAAAHRRRLETLEKDVANYLRERSVLITRIETGTERRKEMLHVLNALLTCEDDTTLTDEQHDARMDSVVKRARVLVSAERSAILSGKST